MAPVSFAGVLARVSPRLSATAFSCARFYLSEDKRKITAATARRPDLVTRQRARAPPLGCYDDIITTMG
jgi:hypothetical protein